MLNDLLLTTPAWAERFIAMNLLRDTQDSQPFDASDDVDLDAPLRAGADLQPTVSLAG